ncbi:hypothetical protein ACFFHH_20155 [Cytobacillus solani]|uniref:hypothetical protein n=1 Tax=Cytobacillus solani TaxID=1637975 RepID=UPI00114F8097|nr:hypothetical protein [Cytobacillus solani]
MLVYESRIKGSFQGYKDRETVFELVNGRAYKQDEYQYQYRYMHSPNVKVYQEGSTYYLEVEGMNSRVRVKKIK